MQLTRTHISQRVHYQDTRQVWEWTSQLLLCLLQPRHIIWICWDSPIPTSTKNIRVKWWKKKSVKCVHVSGVQTGLERKKVNFISTRAKRRHLIEYCWLISSSNYIIGKLDCFRSKMNYSAVKGYFLDRLCSLQLQPTNFCRVPGLSFQAWFNTFGLLKMCIESVFEKVACFVGPTGQFHTSYESPHERFLNFEFSNFPFKRPPHVRCSHPNGPSLFILSIHSSRLLLTSFCHYWEFCILCYYSSTSAFPISVTHLRFSSTHLYLLFHFLCLISLAVLIEHIAAQITG